jgi:hypothetical protein
LAKPPRDETCLLDGRITLLAPTLCDSLQFVAYLEAEGNASHADLSRPTAYLQGRWLQLHIGIT